MTEVNLVKRLIVLGITLSLALNVSACTREKPFDLPTTGVAQMSTPVPVAPTPVGGALPTLVPGPTETPSPTVTLVVQPPTLVVPTVPVTTPTPSAPLAGMATMYTVQWGDWMRKIAEKHGVTVEALIAANPRINPNVIYPGQVLHIPASGGAIATPSTSGATPIPPSGGPTTYTVQQGEWLYQIARKFGISVAQLQAANPGLNPNFLYPGQVLRIPGEGVLVTPTPGGSTGTPNPSNTYTVQPGDTLSSIAVKFKTTPYALQIANNLPNPNAIYPGLVLIVPPQ